MAENTVNADLSFQALLDAIASLKTAEKQKLWEFLEAELFSDETDSPTDLAEIEAARNDYKSGNFVTFDQYINGRNRIRPSY